MPHKLQHKSPPHAPDTNSRPSPPQTPSADPGPWPADVDRTIFSELVQKLILKPGHQYCISLGVFGAANPAKGFSIELLDEPPHRSDSVETRLTAAGTPRQYEITLYVTNYGRKPVRAEIWQMR